MQAASDLPAVRRFEAAGFRAWPAGSVVYDGTWAIRLTASHPAKRLNSVNPLDPSDLSRLGERIARARDLFREAGRALTFRLSPLAGVRLHAHLDGLGWSRFDESIVMRLDLSGLDKGVVQLPYRDRERFIAAAAAIHGYDGARTTGLAGIIGAIRSEAGLFIAEADGRPAATAICVADADLAGLFEVATTPSERGKGHGRRLVLSALNWARTRGAVTGWLQVEASNAAACALYRSIGFAEVYRYVYRQPPEAT